MFRHLTTVAVASLLVTASAQARDLSASRALHEEGALLSARIEGISRQIQSHTDRLTRLARHTSIQGDSHTEGLEEARLLVRRNLLPALKRLEEIQGALPEWKQKSVARMRESADGLSAHLTAAGATKAAEPGLSPAMNLAYRAHVEAAARYTEVLTATSDATSGYLLGRLKAADAGLFPLIG